LTFRIHLQPAVILFGKYADICECVVVVYVMVIEMTALLIQPLWNRSFHWALSVTNHTKAAFKRHKHFHAYARARAMGVFLWMCKL